MRRIYLDHNATTPLDPRVLDAMLPWMQGNFGNPSSLHFDGREARRAVEDAREELALLIGAEPAEIIFTSGATEANNLALSRVVKTSRFGSQSPTLAVSAVEHPSVREPAAALRSAGIRVLELPVDSAGCLRMDEAVSALESSADLVALIVANNEIGTVQPWSELAAEATFRGVSFHLDAVQALGKLPFAVSELGPGTASFSAHKLRGPKGVGALWARRETRIEPALRGGAQERGRRAGTENVSAIVGFGRACRLAREERDQRIRGLRSAESILLGALREDIPDLVLHGPRDAEDRLPGTLNVRIPGVKGELMLIGLDRCGISISLGSACSSGAVLPSPNLEALGIGKVENLESFRVSLGWDHPREELERAARSMALVAGRRAN